MTKQETENKPKKNQPTKFFYLIAGLAFIWNLLGVMAFVGQIFTSSEMIAQMPQAEQKLYNSTPIWATAAFAFAVFGGTLGSLVILMRREFALKLLILSLIGVLIQMFHSFFISDSIKVYGLSAIVMPIMVVTIAIALILWTKHLSVKGVLR